MAKKETKTNKKVNSKNKKSFAKDFKAELKKVIWPTPKQLLNNTIAVITIVLITAAIVFVLDLAFETLNKQGVDRIKEVVTSINTTSDESNDNATSQDALEDNAASEEEVEDNTTSEQNNENVENQENTENQ